MRHLKSYLERVSNEDADNQEPVGVEPVSETVPEANDAVEVGTLVEEEPSANVINAEIEEVSDIQESLENFNVLVDAAIARGGMRPEEGVMFQASLEHFQRRLGVVQSKLGMEDFGGNMSRMKATTISQEDLKETAIAAGKKIKELIMRLIASVKETIAKIDTQGNKVKGIIENLKKNIRHIVGKDFVFEYERGFTFTEGDLTPQGFNDLTKTIQEIIRMVEEFDTAAKKTTVLANSLIKSSGDEPEVSAFDEELKVLWMGSNSPIAHFFGSAKSGMRKLGTLTTLNLVVGDDKDVVNRLGIALEKKYGDSLKLDVTKSDFIRFVTAIEKINNLCFDLTRANANTLAALLDLGVMASEYGSKSPQAAMHINTTSSKLSGSYDKIMEVTRRVSSIRNSLGYLLAQLALEFDKKATTGTDVAITA